MAAKHKSTAKKKAATGGVGQKKAAAKKAASKKATSTQTTQQPKKKAASKKTAAKKTPRKKATAYGRRSTDVPPEQRPWILVTGAGGTLAQLVIARLKQHYRIVALDFRHKPEIRDCEASYCVQFTKREFEDIFRKYPLSGVLHLGRISAQQLNRASRYNANVIGSRKLLDLCARYGVGQVLIFSTYHVYGAHPYNPALIDEEAPLKAAELTMDLVDSVELENLATIYLWRHPEINVTVLRPCNVVGPGVNNTMARLLSGQWAPWVVGFSPMMQFLHVDDAASAVASCFRQKQRGIFNVAPEDWVSYTRALEAANCRRFPIPSMPEGAPYRVARTLRWRAFPPYLVNYFKYPVIIDGSLFRDTFGFEPRYSLHEIFAHYREFKE